MVQEMTVRHGSSWLLQEKKPKALLGSVGGEASDTGASIRIAFFDDSQLISMEEGSTADRLTLVVRSEVAMELSSLILRVAAQNRGLMSDPSVLDESYEVAVVDVDFAPPDSISIQLPSASLLGCFEGQHTLHLPQALAVSVALHIFDSLGRRREAGSQSPD